MTTLSNIIDLTNAPTPPRWFEFLLEPGKLEQHLEANCCDPSPTELITLFFRNVPTLSGTPNYSPTQKSAPITIAGAASQQQTNGSSTPSQSSPPTTTTTNTTTTTSTSPTSTPTQPAPQSSSSPPNNSSSSSSSSNSTNSKDEQAAPTKPQNIANDLADHFHSDLLEVQIPPDSYEAKYRSKKAYALQILAVKVASFLKWDLDVICSELTIPIQYKLMQALRSACSPDNCPTEVKKFAHIIYRHWFIRSAITYQVSTLQPQSSNTAIIYLSQMQQQQHAADSSAMASMAEVFALKSEQLLDCSNELDEYIEGLSKNAAPVKASSPKKMRMSSSQQHPFKSAKLSRPKLNCFNVFEEALNDWSSSEMVEAKDMIEAACYDLGRFFFSMELYDLAKQKFELIKDSKNRFPKLPEYLESASQLMCRSQNGVDTGDNELIGEHVTAASEKMKKTEKYLFDCMTQFSESRRDKSDGSIHEDVEMNHQNDNLIIKSSKDVDLRISHANNVDNSTWLKPQTKPIQEQQLMAGKGDVFMSQGNFKQAMSCFIGALLLTTDYFRFFSKNYTEEEPYISRMIQCSISLSCYTQAVALCQMSKNLNYTIAFKQLNERVCNDCCDDIYECIWDVTLLEYIISLHTKRGELERRAKVIQLIGQLELNENNPEDVLKEAEHIRRGKFFRILSNKYL